MTKRKISKGVLLDILLGALSLIIPLVILYFAYSNNGFTLTKFSGNTVMTFDMQSQYVSFMRYYRESLLTGKSMVYTTSSIFGSEFLPLFCYYLASPFNLLVVFFRDIEIPFFFAWTSMIKLAIAGLNMYIMLRLLFKERKIGYVGFAIAYALVSSGIAEMHNFMWLDCIMILPLTYLGFRYIEERKHLWLYPLTLGYGLITSWYVGAFICIFMVILYVSRIINMKKEDIKSYTIRFALASLIGGLISAVIWLTAFLHLGGTKATGGLPKQLKIFPLSMFFYGLLTNNFPSSAVLTMDSGYMTAFTSVVTLVFAQLYFFNKEYNFKERMTNLGLVVLYFLVVQVNVLNALFHGGQEPTWFPARYSFIIGFIIVYIAALGYNKIEKLNFKALLCPVISAVAVLLLVCLVPNPNLAERHLYDKYIVSSSGLTIYIITIVAILVYLFLKAKKKIPAMLLDLSLATLVTVLIGISSSEGTQKIVKGLKKENPQSFPLYLTDCDYQAGIDNIKNIEPYNNYRMELTVNRPGNYNDVNNNPMFYSYTGLNHFSSNIKKDVAGYFEKLGFHDNGYFQRYDGGSTLAINSLLGVKYIIDEPLHWSSNKPSFMSSDVFQQLSMPATKRRLYYYRNNLAMPLGFAANKTHYTFINEGNRGEGKQEILWFNHLEYQNEIFKTLVSDVVEYGDVKKDIFLPLTEVSKELTNLTEMVNEYGESYYTTVNPKLPSYISLVYKELPGHEQDNLYFGEKDNKQFRYIVDGYEKEMNYWHKGIRGLAHTHDQRHTVRVIINKPIKNERIAPELYSEDMQVLKQYFGELQSQGSYNLIPINTSFSYGFEGSFNLNKQDQMFYFTLPYETGFKAYVDGKAVKPKLRWNIFMGIDLDGLEPGEHKIKIVYNDNKFIFGLCITPIGIASLVAFCVIENKKKKEEQIAA